MASFAFVPRSVKKKQSGPVIPRAGGATSSLLPEERREVSPKTPLISTSASARLASESVRPRGNSKGKSKGQDYIANDVQPSTSVNPEPRSSTPAKGPNLEEFASLVCLSLSDYHLWVDADLRRNFDWSFSVHDDGDDRQDNSGDSLSDDSGYVPLDYLFHHSRIFTHAMSSPNFAHQPETTYVKALRVHASHLLDVRLVLSSEDHSYSRKGFGGQYHKNSTKTGYEVRRKALTKDHQNDPSGHGKVDWDRLTIYFENIPVQFRSLAGTLKLVTALLPPSSVHTASYSGVQNIVFPPHHRDLPTSIPVCKGFALVTLSSPEEVNYLLEAWPWVTPPPQNLHNTDDEIVVDSGPSTSQNKEESKKIAAHANALIDAQKFGLRALSKARWDELRAEYLLYRQQLVDEINQHQEEEAPRKRVKTSSGGAKATESKQPESSGGSSRGDRRDTKGKTSHGSSTEAVQECPPIHAGSPYPSGCLTFVRNVHPDTNKTTLRALFSQAWKQDKTVRSSGKAVAIADGLDYIDYMKSMDNCYIRLSTPQHAEQLVAYFTSHPTTQTSGLDGIGKEAELTSKEVDETPNASIIKVEPILGKREQVYWEKVPEKVRRQAVDKALRLIGGDGLQGTVAGGGKINKRKK